MAYSLQNAIQANQAYQAAHPSQSKDSNIKNEFTIEQVKEEAGCSKFEVVPASISKTGKAFFACGLVRGAISKNLQTQLDAGVIPAMKVLYVDKKEADSFGPAYTGLQLVEDKPREGVISL